MQFTHIEFLRVAPVALLLIIAILAFGYKMRVNARRRYGREELIGKFTAPISATAEIAKILAWSLIAALLLLVAAGPFQTEHEGKIPIGSVQLVALIDASPSFAAEDYRDDMPALNGVPPQEVLGPYGRRIDMVRMVMENQIIPAIAGNQLGVVLFGGEAKNQVELEDDLDKIKWEFKNHWIEVGQAPGDGSDYVKGLEKALMLFANTPEPKRDKVIIVFSDGGMDGDTKNLASLTNRINGLNIKVIVVGVGTEQETPIRVYNENGTFKGLLKLPNCDDKDADGNCQTKLNVGNLNQLAAGFNTTPIYLKAGEKLPISWSSKIAGSKVVHERTHTYHGFLLTALALLLLLQLRGIRFGSGRSRRNRR